MKRDRIFEKWWPTTQSLDLVEGSVQDVARCLQAEVARFVKFEPLRSVCEPVSDLDSLFSRSHRFNNVPTYFVVIPTNSKWSVLWNNSFLCNGYDSLCYCLTENHGMSTLHWMAHDESSTFQAGTSFIHRRYEKNTIIERSVYCIKEDKKWIFGEFGQALPEEDLSCYKAKRKQDRLNQEVLLNLLKRLGAEPWSEAYYALNREPCFILERTVLPSSIVTKTVEEVLKKAKPT